MNWCRYLLLCSLITNIGFVAAHSPLYPDSFEFDQSNDGGHPEFNRSSGANPLSQAISNPITTCTGGLAGDYPCKNIQLMSFMSTASLGGGGSNLNDIWGWTDLVSGREIAIVGKTNGTAFVDVTDPVNPSLLGFLPSRNGGAASWRDIKVYADHAFIVADGTPNANHGLQVFDLSQLRGITPGTTLTTTAGMNGVGAAHNIAINEDTGFAYIVGSNIICGGGLYMVDISNPTQPQEAGCFSDDGYTHDVQCVTYTGPDTVYFGNEICVAYNEDSITIVDVTNKAQPREISRTVYTGVQYTHQGWFLDDNHTYLIMNDELDESRGGFNTTSHLYDVSDLDNPIETGRYRGVTRAIDHNLYTLNNFVFESNYRAGLRILRSTNIATGSLAEVAYFDTIPCSNDAQFSGVWSTYIYFPSGNIVSSDIGGGLFVLQADWSAINDPNLQTDTQPAMSPACSVGGGNGGGSGGGSSGGGGNSGSLLLLATALYALRTLFKQRPR
jgi:choice-of-anchor B domain-containing protein